MRSSLSRQSVVITLFFARRVFFLLLLCWRAPRAWRNTFGELQLPRPCLSSMITPPSKMKTIRLSRKSTLSAPARPWRPLREHISLSCSLGCCTSPKGWSSYSHIAIHDSVVRRCVRFAKWKYEGKQSFKQQNAMFERLFNRVRSDMVGLDPEIVGRNLVLSHRNVVEG